MEVNGATLVLDLSTSLAPSYREAFRRAWPLLEAAARAGSGERLAVVAVPAFGVPALAAVEPGRFLVIGRHTRCRLVLPDPEASLRHLVVAWGEADGGPRLRVWDLRTGAGFVTEDGEETRAVVADAHLFCQLAGVTLLFLPLGSLAGATSAEDGWSRLPSRRYIGLNPEPQRREPRPGDTITHTLPAVVFGEDGPRGTPAARVAIETPDARLERRLSWEQLDRGVLFGRYERCQLVMESDGWLSRVHLLLVRQRGRVWAIDTSSTNGTLSDGKRVEALELGATGAIRLQLGKCFVTWTPVGAVAWS